MGIRKPRASNKVLLTTSLILGLSMIWAGVWGIPCFVLGVIYGYIWYPEVKRLQAEHEKQKAESEIKSEMKK